MLMQMDTGARSFLPRLGAAIDGIAISADGRDIAVHTADRTLRIVRAAGMRITAVARGLARDGSQPPALVADPRAATAVVPAGRGALQWIDVARELPVADLQVALAGPHGAAAHVTHAAFSGDGVWLATAEHRAASKRAASALALWRWDADAQTYTLTARVDQPHRAPVTALSFHPTQPRVSAHQATGASCCGGAEGRHRGAVWPRVCTAAPRCTRRHSVPTGRCWPSPRGRR